MKDSLILNIRNICTYQEQKLNNLSNKDNKKNLKDNHSSCFFKNQISFGDKWKEINSLEEKLAWKDLNVKIVLKINFINQKIIIMSLEILMRTNQKILRNKTYKKYI